MISQLGDKKGRFLLPRFTVSLSVISFEMKLTLPNVPNP